MLNSALIGCFTVQRISVAHRKEARGKFIFYINVYKMYISILSRTVILLGNYTVNKNAGIREPLLICWALKLLSNARSHFNFTFEIARTLLIEWQYLPHILRDQMLVSGAQDL